MHHLPGRVIAVSSFAGLSVVAIGLAAWSWLGGDEPDKAAASVARGAASREPARLESVASSALKSAARQPHSEAAVQRTAANQNMRATRQPAHVEPYEQTAIFAKAAGFVSVVHVDLGDRVKKGQVLAELWIPEMEQQLSQKKALVEEARAVIGQADAAVVAAEAQVAAAAEKVREAQAVAASHQAEIKFRRSEHDRFAQLVRTSQAVEPKLVEEKLRQLESAEAALAAAKAGIASARATERVEQARLEQSRANLVFAQAKLQVAQADQKQTEVLMAYAEIRAPYDSVVIERHIDTGDFVQSAADAKSQPLFSVIRTEPLRIVTDIPEADASWFRLGLPATLTVDSIKDRSFAGTVRRMSDMLDQQTRTLRIEIDLTEPAEELRPGMYGVVEIRESSGTSAQRL